jgi:UDP-N-acetyl-2-amino-2-deoxyglucuronate dehydrogenase
MLLAMARELAIAIAGAGAAARTHAGAISAVPGLRLVGMAGRAGWRALLARPEVDVLVVATPSAVRRDIVEEACARGKALVVEKPLAATLEDARAVAAAIDGARLPSAICLQARWHPTFCALREALRAGLFGRVVLAHCRLHANRDQAYYDGSDWRGRRAMEGGGALMNQGIHGLDLIDWLAGPVAAVAGAAAARLVHERIDVEDTLVASLRLASGALGTLVAATGCFPNRPRRIEVVGDRGSIEIENMEVRFSALRDGAPPAALSPAPEGAPRPPADLAHRLLYEDLRDALREGRDTRHPAREGLRSVALVEAVYRASEARREVAT